MLLDLIKAVIVGIAASVPVGPIAIFVIQKTLSKGFKPGFITSLGATVVDTLFAIVAIFALAYVQAFIDGNAIPIMIVGGIIVTSLGISMTLSDPFRKMKNQEKKKSKRVHDVSAADFLSACAMGISNPGAIAVMLALMAFFGLGDDMTSNWDCFLIIAGVAAGSAMYWLMLVCLLNIFRKQFNMRTLIWINRITGAVVIVLGLSTLASGVFALIKPVL